MARATIAKRIQKSYRQNAKKLKKNHLSPLLAGLAGAILTVPLMLALILPIMHQEFAAQAASINRKLVSMMPVANYTASQTAADSGSLACVAPSGGAGAGTSSTPSSQPAVQTASATTPSHESSKPSTPPGSNVITKMISNYQTSNQATISDTGAGSTNKVVQTTNNSTAISNTNEVNATNNNPQTASSGDVTSSDNTTSGDTTSGGATNTADVSFIFKVNN